MKPVLTAEEVSKNYATKRGELTVLRDINFSLLPGSTCAVVGPSGSGKTTLLSLCAGLDYPSSGSIHILGQNLGMLSEEQRAALRNRSIGFVFQSFHLMAALTAVENVMLPFELLGGKQAHTKASELLKRVGLKNRQDHYPAQLSGGEQQRVALARAFINDPKILFADEPTGNLDPQTAERVTELLFNLNRELGTTLMLITHNRELAERTGRVLHLQEGTLHES